MSRLHVSTTRHPAVSNCTRCENLLTGRDDGMPTYVVQGTRENGRWLTEFLCEPCAQAEGYATHDAGESPTASDREAVWRPAQFETLKAPARYPAPSWEGPGRVVELFDNTSALGYLVNQGDALAWLSYGTGRDSALILRMAWYREQGLDAGPAFDLLTLRNIHTDPRPVDLAAFRAAWDAENAT